MKTILSVVLLWTTAVLSMFSWPASALAATAACQKPLPGVHAEWLVNSPVTPGQIVSADLRVTANIPGLQIRVSVPDGHGWILGDVPAFRGSPPPGEPLEFPVVLNVPQESRRLVAVVEVESVAGRYEVHALLEVPPAGPAETGRQGVLTVRGERVVEYAAAPTTLFTDRTKPLGSRSPTVVLTGGFHYRDRLIGPDGFVNENLVDDPIKPIRFANVELLENGIPVDAGLTDTTGAFSFSATPSGGESYQVRVTSSTAEWGATDIRVRFSPGNLSLYGALSSSIQDPAGDTDLGDFIVVPGQGGEAFNVLDMAVAGVHQIEMYLGDFPVFPLSYYWNASSNFFTGFDRTSLSITLHVDDAYDDPVVLHEFGHYLTWIYSKDENPGGIHFLDDPAQDVRLAWGEGFAGYFQASVRARLGEPFPTWYVDTFGGAGAGQLFFSYEVEGPSLRLLGIGNEVVVQAALWDIEDGAGAVGDPAPGIDDDLLDLTGFEIWEVITGPIKSATSVCIEDFWDGWFDPSVNNGFRTEMEQAFTELGMEFYPDSFEDDDTPGNATLMMTNGDSRHHTFYPLGDEDHHRFNLEAGEQIIIETLNILSYGDTFVELLDSTLTVIGGNDDRSSVDFSSLLDFTAPQAGTYFVRVRRALLDARARYADYGSYDVRVVRGIENPVTLIPVPSEGGVSSSRLGVGVAFADYDADGYVDLYVVNNDAAGPALGWDHLYRNNRDFTFQDVTIAAGLGNPEGQLGVAWGDCDNDGDPDLFVSDHGFFRNEGGSFMNETSASKLLDIGREFDAAWVDADVDGHLDLFVLRRDGPSALWHNNADGTFTDVAPSAGFNFPVDGGDAYSCVWGDYDNDRLPDLFIARRTEPAHALYRNLGNNQFLEVTDDALVSGDDPATGGIWGDVNDDGWLDLFVCSLGQNRLYVNEGDGTFIDRAALYGVHEYGASQGGGFVDYDMDGDLDLYVVNSSSANAHYENLGGTMIRTRLANDLGVGNGAAWADVDNDGDAELYLSRGCTSQGCQSNRMYENAAFQTTSRRWLKVSLDGVDSNRDGIGSSILVYTSAGVQHRQVGTGVGWASKSRVPELYGFRNGVSVDSMEVRWPSGVVDVVRGPVLNTVLTVVERSTTPVLPETLIPLSVVLTAPFPNPFHGATTMAVTLTRDSDVVVEIFDLSGRRVRSLADRRFEKGTHIVGWDGRSDRGDLTLPGVYFYRVVAGTEKHVKKLVRLGDG